MERLVLNVQFHVLSGCFLKCNFVKYVCYIVNLKIKHLHVSLDHYTVLVFLN